MKHVILTGAPGSGKTSILRALVRQGHEVVEEAATDVIAAEQAKGRAEPWRDPGFIEMIAAAQHLRRRRPGPAGAPARFYDRSPVCTLALARYLGHPVPALLSAEIARILRGGVYERRVLFVRPIGFCEATPARQISYEDSLIFERAHEIEYERCGFQIVEVPAASVAERAAMVLAHVAAWR